MANKKATQYSEKQSKALRDSGGNELSGWGGIGKSSPSQAASKVMRAAAGTAGSGKKTAVATVSKKNQATKQVKKAAAKAAIAYGTKGSDTPTYGIGGFTSMDVGQRKKPKKK